MPRKIVFSAFLCFIFSPIGAHSQLKPYVIQGRVLDPQGRPVAEALLTLRNSLSGQSQQQRTTTDGRYSFRVSETGSYTLTASHSGFSDQVRLLQFKPEHRFKTEDIRLPLSGVRQDVTVISGSRVEELQQDSPSPVTVVTHQQIVDTGKETVGGVLSEVPGVVTRDYSTHKKGIADEQVQGIDSRQVLVLEDGLPIVGARGVNSGVIDLNAQPVGPLDQIEVAKGAGSALYGTDAIGGVINLITRKPASPLDADLNFSGGSLGVFDGRGSLGSRVKNGWFLADLERHQGDSYSLIPPSTTGPQYGLYDGFFKGSYSLGDRTTLGFRANGYRNHDVGQSQTETGLSRSNDAASSQSFALRGDFQLTPSSMLQVRGYLANYNENDLTLPVGESSESPDISDLANLGERYHHVDATWSQTIGVHQFLQAGYEWVQDSYKGVNRLVGGDAGQQIATNDLWAQDRIQVVSPLLLTLGVRYQHHSLYGSHAVPKLGLSYRINQHLAYRASFGYGFRAPDLGQLYYRFANPASFYQVIGNPNLRPETSRSINTGFDYHRARWRGNLQLYRNDVSNLIDYFYAGTPQDEAGLGAIRQQYNIPADFNLYLDRMIFIYLNLGRIYTEGAEVSSQYALTSRISLRGAYAYLDAYDKISHTELPNRSRHQGFAEVMYNDPARGFTANLRGSLFSNWLLDETGDRASGYGIWSLYSSKRLVRGASFYTAIDNLFNSRDPGLRDNPPTYNRPDYGRTFRIGIRYTFSRHER